MIDLRSNGTNTPHIGWVLNDNFSGQPTLANNVLYVNDGGILVAFDELTGSRLWAWAPSPSESLTGTIIATENHLFVGTGVATYAIDLASHNTVWSYPVSGSLALGDGVLYVAGTDGTLTAFDTLADSTDPVSNPGGPYTAECHGASTTVQLDGSASSDPAGYPLAFYWSSDSATATFNDPSSPTPTLTIDATAAEGCTVTLTVSDGQRTNSAQAVVTVVDTKPPTILCGTNKVVGRGKNWCFDAPVASDACCGTNVTITVLGTVTNVVGCALNVTRTWQATDGSGNSNQGSQTVTLVDAAPPTIQIKTNKVVRLGMPWNFDTPVAFTCNGSRVAIKIVNTTTNVNGCAVNVTRTWQATDGWGNSSVASQTVTLLDTQPLNLSPLVALLFRIGTSTNQMLPIEIKGMVTNACGATADYWIASVTPDRPKTRSPGNGGWKYEITGPRTVLLRADLRERLAYTITVKAKDTCGNTGTCGFPVLLPALQ